MKKLLVILLTVVVLMTTASIAFADPQNGGDDPFEFKTTYIR